MDGDARLIDCSDISKSDLPLFWVANGEHGVDAGIIRGIQNKGVMIETVGEKTRHVSMESIAEGYLFNSV